MKALSSNFSAFVVADNRIPKLCEVCKKKHTHTCTLGRHTLTPKFYNGNDLKIQYREQKLLMTRFRENNLSCADVLVVVSVLKDSERKGKYKRKLHQCH